MVSLWPPTLHEKNGWKWMKMDEILHVLKWIVFDGLPNIIQKTYMGLSPQKPRDRETIATNFIIVLIFIDGYGCIYGVVNRHL